MTATPQRLRCCICGNGTSGATDYLQLALSVEDSEARQFFGAHARCLSGVMAPGFQIEIID
jgi:hypothetical protein